MNKLAMSVSPDKTHIDSRAPALNSKRVLTLRVRTHSCVQLSGVGEARLPGRAHDAVRVEGHGRVQREARGQRQRLRVQDACGPVMRFRRWHAYICRTAFAVS